MAEIDYFLEPKSWKVIGGNGTLTQFLPAKGSIRIEAQKNGSSQTYRVVPAGRSRSKSCEGFKYLKGRLERPLKDAACVLVIEQGDNSDGMSRLRGRFEPRPRKGVKQKPAMEVTGTWGAETNPGSGGRT